MFFLALIIFSRKYLRRGAGICFYGEGSSKKSAAPNKAPGLPKKPTSKGGLNVNLMEWNTALNPNPGGLRFCDFLFGNMMDDFSRAIDK